MKVVNKKALFDYEVVESYEVGVVLTGAEVKSTKTGQVSLTGSRVVNLGGEMWVIGMNIPQYKNSSLDEYDPARRRKLLLKREEIVAIESKRQSAGLTVVPLAVYNKGSLIKLEIGLVRGKKKYEKREVLKKRTEERQLARMLKK